MRDNAAPGPDEIPPILLKMLRDEVARPLTKLFQRSIDEGRIPEDWRNANVVPIFKKGSRFEPGNYRPVSLTSVVGKLLERIIKNEIEAHVENNKLINDSQHGFRRGRSTQTNLIEFLNVTTRWADEGNCYDVIYICIWIFPKPLTWCATKDSWRSFMPLEYSSTSVLRSHWDV